MTIAPRKYYLFISLICFVLNDQVGWGVNIIGWDQKTYNRDCGVNCLFIACRLFDIQTNKEEMTALTRLSHLGTNLYDLKQAALGKGLYAKIVRWDIRQLQKWPYLALVHWENHFVLLKGAEPNRKNDTQNNSVYVIDPPEMPYTLTTEDFAAKWDGYCLLLSNQPIVTGMFPDKKLSVISVLILLILCITAYGLRKVKFLFATKERHETRII